MKDIPPEIHRSNLPPCPFSVHCVRLLEDLDPSGSSSQDAVFFLADTAQDRQLRIQLRAHLPGCPTCTAIVAGGYALRSWQRQQLRRVLAESERMVPSSTARIMQAIAREQETVPEKRVTTNGHKPFPEEKVLPSPYLHTVAHVQKPVHRPQKRLQNVLAFSAVAAILIASFSIFNHLVLFRSTPLSGAATFSKSKVISASVIHTTTWSSMLIALVSGGQTVLTSIDPITGKSAVLASVPSAGTTTIDGVSHDGYQIIYHVFDGSRTRYYLWSSTQNTVFYTVPGKGGLALWNTDDSAVFISVPEGVEKVAVSSHVAVLVVSLIKAPDLRFYRDGYLYFTTDQNASVSTWLNRIDLSGGKIVPITAGLCQLSYDFWLSPGGKIVYYRCRGQSVLYAVGSDGVGTRVVRANVGRIIGYTAQGEPLTLSRVNTTFQVVALGVDVQHDKTVVVDVAPGASDLAVEDIAVAPYGFSLVALGHYQDGSAKLWYDNLTMRQQNAIPAVSVARSVQPIGWCRLQVVASKDT